MWSYPDIALDILDDVGCENETARAIAGGRWSWNGEHAHYTEDGQFIDGTYPPSPLHHSDIHPAARIIEAVDAFRALTSPNPLRDRDALPLEQGLEKFKTLSGNLLDPTVVDVVVHELEKGLLKTHSRAKAA